MRSNWRRTRDGRRGPRERGAVLVEAAFVVPILLMLVFGIIEWGLTFKDSLTVSSTTRAGARTASSLARNATFDDATVAAVDVAMSALGRGTPRELVLFRAGSDGKPVSGSVSTCTSSCLRYTWNSSTSSWTYQNGTWDPTSQVACVGAGGPPHEVGVYLRARHDFLTGFFGDGIDLTDTTVMRFEPRTITEGCR